MSLFLYVLREVSFDNKMFFEPEKSIEKHGPKLPHWQQEGAMQFVTFRLADAMPKSKLIKWAEEQEAWLNWNPKPWSFEKEQEYHRLFTQKMEGWLDAGAGSCLFREPENRTLLAETLMHDQGAGAEHEAWVIMLNHAHLLFTPKKPLEQLLKTWKGVTARKVGQGSIWQKGYRDTLIRHQEHYANVVRYIRKNPKNLRQGEFALWEGPRAKRI